MQSSGCKESTASSVQDAILLLGPTAAGKTPLGDMLSQQGLDGKKCRHFDFGKELRRIVANGRNMLFSQDDVDFIDAVLEQGLLLENKHFFLAKKIIHAFLSRESVGDNDLIVLNGLPRHKGQAEGMDDIVAIDLLIILHCSPDDVLCRIQENTGGDRKGRNDDSAGLVARKMAIYEKRTAPLVNYYKERRARIIDVNVKSMSETSDIYKDVVEQYRSGLRGIQ